MRQSEKNNLSHPPELRRIRFDELERSRFVVVRKAREDFRERFTGELPRRGSDKVDMRMTSQQTHQVFADVTGSADNRDFRVLRSHNAQCVCRLASIATKHFSIVAAVYDRRPSLDPARMRSPQPD